MGKTLARCILAQSKTVLGVPTLLFLPPSFLHNCMINAWICELSENVASQVHAANNQYCGSVGTGLDHFRSFVQHGAMEMAQGNEIGSALALDRIPAIMNAWRC